MVLEAGPHEVWKALPSQMVLVLLQKRLQRDGSPLKYTSWELRSNFANALIVGFSISAVTVTVT